MKKCAALTIIILSLLLHACQKKVPELDKLKTPYRLDNLHDCLANYGEPTELVEKLCLTDSAYNGTKFTITPSGLPAGITVTPASLDVNSTDSFAFYFSTTTVAAGTYPIRLNITSPDRYTSISTFNIIVQANCSSTITGNWNVHDSGSIALFPADYTAFVSSSGSSNMVEIDLFATSLICTLNCGKGTLTSAPYSGLHYDISEGTGTFDAHKIVVKYVMYTTPNIYVTTTLTR